MSSFYGGGGGVSNYSDLKDAPIKNIGSATTTTYLSGLDFGHYNLTGAYAGSIYDEVQPNSEVLDVMVVRDETTNRRVVFFFTIENNEVVVNNYVYDEDGNLVQHNKHTLSDVAHVQWEDM